MPIEVRTGKDRFLTSADGRTTRHSFSFGAHYDPHNVGFGALIALNDELLPPGTGYPDHPHLDTEIVTLVLSGALRHRDSAGNEGVLEPGQVQLLSAGSGVVHSESSAAPDVATRFVQMWVRPDSAGLEPSYATGSLDLADGRLTCVATGDGDDALPLHARGTSLHLASLGEGTTVHLPQAPRLHVFVAAGAVTIGDRLLDAGAAGRLIEQGGRSVTAGEDGTQLIVWALP